MRVKQITTNKGKLITLMFELTRSQVAMQLNNESSPVVFQTADEVFAMD